jgi:DHA2 family multidrug resistance protein
MTQFDLSMTSKPIIVSGIIQGFGIGLIFVPLSTLAFATLPTRLRNEGAAMFTLIRNIGSAIGISVLQAMTIRNTAIVHSRLVESVRPDNPVLQMRMPDFDLTIPEAVTRLNAQISHQAAMVSYIDAFWALFVLSLLMTPVILLMRPARKTQSGGDLAMHLD